MSFLLQPFASSSLPCTPLLMATSTCMSFNLNHGTSTCRKTTSTSSKTSCLSPHPIKYPQPPLPSTQKPSSSTRHSPSTFLFLFFFTALRCNPSLSQTISTNMPLPPMEWIKLQPSGTTSPPALSHGCFSGPTFSDSTDSNPTTNKAFLFGGRSAAGTSSSGIYILDYSSQTPTWSQPPTTPSTLFTSSPRSRSHLLCGWDSSSNFRNQLNVFGGRSQDGQPLDDFWFYDPTNNFWAQPQVVSPSHHPANYGGIGGMDPTFQPSPPGTSNAIVYVGGASSSHSNENLTPSSLSIDGQLGSNTNTVLVNHTSLASGLTGNASANNLLNGRWGMTGTAMPGLKIVAFSGCNGDPNDEFKDTPDASCSLLNGGVLQFESGFAASKLATISSPPQSSWTSFNYCPAPRVGGTMVPNRNRFDSSFAHQVIMIGGRMDTNNWDDQGGSKLGEVDVLDISSGVWSRVIPMRRDNATFTQKEGLLALALPSVIGAKGSGGTSGSTDILVYGGIDVSTGEASNELWVLRLHAAKLNGNGTADGITMSYLPSCVSPTPHNTHDINKLNNSTGNFSGKDGSSRPLEAPPGHFIFSTLALALLMLALTILRCEEPGRLSIKRGWRTSRLWLLAGGWNILAISYAFLVIGIVIPLFQSRDPFTVSLTKRGLFTGDSTHRKLRVKDTLSRSFHARLGLVVGFAGLIMVPGLYLLSWFDASLKDRRQKQLSSGGPRKLKAKGSQGPGLKQRALERMVMLTQPFNRSKTEKTPSLISGSAGHDRPESSREKHSDMLVDQELSAPSSRELSPRLPPLAVESNTHERLGSISTAYTHTQLLAKTGGFGIESGQHGQLLSTSIPLTQRPSQPQLKPLSSPLPERQLIRSPVSPFSKVFQNLSNSLFTPSSPAEAKNPSNETKANLAEKEDSRVANLSSSISTTSAFEVLNRKPPSRQQRGPNVIHPRATRVSLDILSDSGSSHSAPSHMLHPNSRAGNTADEHGSTEERKKRAMAINDRDYLEVTDQEHLDEHLGEEEDDDDDDSEYNKQIKARRKMRRLADMMLHSILLVTNIYLIANCFVSTRDLKWLGIVYACFCMICYSAMLWFAWNGQPSSESTLVIFISIIKDGSRNLMKNENLPGLGQFSSFRQQQQHAQQMLAQQMIGNSMGSAVEVGGTDRSTTMGRRFHGLSMYSASQASATGAGSLINSPDFSFRGYPGMIRSASPTETDVYCSGSNHNHNAMNYMGASGLGGYPNHLLQGVTPGQWERSSSREEEIFQFPNQNRGATVGGGMDLEGPQFSDEGQERGVEEEDHVESETDQVASLSAQDHNRMGKSSTSPRYHKTHREDASPDLHLEDKRRSEIGESYLAHREVQIVTTAPRRKLTVVNN